MRARATGGSFNPQRLHRVEFRGACGGQPHGEQRHQTRMIGTVTNTWDPTT